MLEGDAPAAYAARQIFFEEISPEPVASSPVLAQCTQWYVDANGLLERIVPLWRGNSARELGLQFETGTFERRHAFSRRSMLQM
jgi:hypothetical protein